MVSDFFSFPSRSGGLENKRSLIQNHCRAMMGENLSSSKRVSLIQLMCRRVYDQMLKSR